MTRSSEHIGNDDAPMVSVVMIACNNEATLREAIDGVLGQQCDFSIELLVSDDASSDSTPAIIDEYARLYPGVVMPLHHDVNVGIQRNYLSVFPHCRGRYMAMCDADDYWCSRHKLARQVAYMESHEGCAVCFHRVVNLYLPSREMSLSGRPARADMTINDLARANVITNMSVMYRRSLVDLGALPGWMEEVKLVDYVMHMLYAAHGSIHFINRPMGVYRQWSGGAWSRTSRERQLAMSLKVRQYLMEQFSDRPAVVAGLKEASLKIEEAMARVAAGETGLPPRSGVKGLLTTVRKMVSRLLPVPRPARQR